MYILKNALISICRNKGRNLLIGIIVVVIAWAVTIALAIRSTSNKLISSYESEYDITATIGINRESMRGEMQMDKDMNEEEKDAHKNNMQDMFNEASDITIEQIDNYGNSDYVKDYYYVVNVGINSSLEKATMSNDNNSGGFEERKDNFQNIKNGDFTLIGYSSILALDDFVSGKKTITEGTIINNLKNNECLINLELATLNDISIGDTIKLIDPNDEENIIEVEVIGIFTDNDDENNAMGMFTSSINTIITNDYVANSLLNNDENLTSSITPTFILTDKSVIENFTQELTSKGLSEYLTISTNLDQVEGATKTIANVSSFALTFLIVTLLIGTIVLLVINMINIRERKYEIGVLRTMGMKKRNVALQFIYELLIVSLVSLLVGGILGSLTSVPVSNYLLETEIANNQEQKNNINENFGGHMEDKINEFNGMANIDAFDSINAVVDIKVLMELFGIGLLLTLVGSSVAIVSIQRFSPLTILKERS